MLPIKQYLEEKGPYERYRLLKKAEALSNEDQEFVDDMERIWHRRPFSSRA